MMDFWTQQEVNSPLSEKAQLAQVLNHIEMEMQQKQQNEADDPQSQSTDEQFVSHVPRTISIQSETRSSSSTICTVASKEGSDNDDTMATANLRNATDLSRRSSNSSTASVPSLVSTRPAKRARKTSVDSSDQDCDTTPRTVSPLPQHQKSSLLLLAREEDELHLNPLHVFIRKQIEVFTATAADLAQPAPGRKQPIQLHQVGLRCIHCRYHLSYGDKKMRVKRAVCYPSTVGRIYNSVSDMKFDHFALCKKLPPDIRKTFESLKAEGNKHTKSASSKMKGHTSSSTAQYYRDSATRMGLIDSPGGIIYLNKTRNQTSQHGTNMAATSIAATCVSPQAAQLPDTASSLLQQHQWDQYRKILLQQQSASAANAAAVASMVLPQMYASQFLVANSFVENGVLNPGMLQSILMNAIASGASAQKLMDALTKQQEQIIKQHQAQNLLKRPHESSNYSSIPIPSFLDGKVPPKKTIVPLAASEDVQVLNPIHCFVRKHVEFFAADENDISAPCPGRKTRVTLGQVGIRCKHCAKLQLPPKQRAKRAVCYPPCIDAIYHSVSNMKFDHFGICPGLPPVAKEELATLRSACSGRRQSSGNNKNTAQFYRDSAVTKGLVDTEKGIRFSDTSKADAPNTEQEVSTEKKVNSVSALNGASSIHTAAPKEDASKFPTGMSALMAAASQATNIEV